MKKGTENLLKFKKLKRTLSVPLYAACGILEAIWATTIREARRGDLGRLTDEEIESEIEWDGEPNRLVPSLVDSGWLEEHAAHRLVVHGWSEHAPTWLKGVIKRDGCGWAEDDPPDFQTKCTTKSNTKYITNREGTGTGLGTGSGTDKVDLDVGVPCFLEWFNEYPEHRRSSQTSAQTAYADAIEGGACPDMMLAKVIEYANSPKGKSRFAVGAARWLVERTWLEQPAAWQDDGSNPTNNGTGHIKTGGQVDLSKLPLQGETEDRHD